MPGKFDLKQKKTELFGAKRLRNRLRLGFYHLAIYENASQELVMLHRRFPPIADRRVAKFKQSLHFVEIMTSQINIEKIANLPDNI